MNKKLFIFMFLLMASPIFAQEDLTQDIVKEERPSLNEVSYPDTNEMTFTQKVKNFSQNLYILKKPIKLKK